MKIYEYNRISTNSQEVAQQHNTVVQFLNLKGWSIDETVSDEGVSGGVSYKDRNLFRLLQRMQEGDVLIVSELSRLGRSMADLSKLVNEELKPRKLRLIVVKMSLDIDCSNIRAIDEMILFAFSFAAQLEKELIQDRTQSALDVRRQKLENGETLVSKSGRTYSKFGRPFGYKKSKESIEARAKAGREKARNNPNNISFMTELRIWESEHGEITPKDDIKPFMRQLALRNLRTSRGMEFTPNRCWAMLRSMRKIFA